MGSDAPPFTEALAGFKSELQRQRPTVEFFTYDFRGLGVTSAENDLSQWARDMDLVLILGSSALERTLQATDDGPDVVSVALRREDIRQSENATGVFLEFPLRTQFDWMQRFLPEARRIGVVYNAQENRALIAEAAKVARARGLQLVSREVASPRDLPAALSSLTNTADALWGISDRIVVTPQTAKELLLFSFRNRIPFIGLSEAWVRAGALYALERDYLDIGQQCATLADDILRGRGKSSLPPESPRSLHYMINLRTAEQMKVDIHDRLLRQAEKLY